MREWGVILFFVFFPLTLFVTATVAKRARETFRGGKPPSLLFSPWIGYLLFLLYFLSGLDLIFEFSRNPLEQMSSFAAILVVPLLFFLIYFAGRSRG